MGIYTNITIKLFNHVAQVVLQACPGVYALAIKGGLHVHSLGVALPPSWGLCMFRGVVHCV
jgi:hypothetical protein